MLARPLPLSLRPLSRSFFKLPSFAPTPPPTKPNKGTLRKVGQISLYEEGRVMAHTPEQLYSIIADVDSYTKFLPFATKSAVLQASLRPKTADSPTPTSPSSTNRSAIASQGWLGKGQHEGEVWDLEAELNVGAMGYSEGYVSRIELRKFSRVTATAKDSSLFKHLVTRWELTPLPPLAKGGIPQTQVDLSLAYAFASPFHAAAVNTVWEKVSGLMVDGFEKRVVQVYGSEKR